jgi:hypothetical protein
MPGQGSVRTGSIGRVVKHAVAPHEIKGSRLKRQLEDVSLNYVDVLVTATLAGRLVDGFIHVDSYDYARAVLGK